MIQTVLAFSLCCLSSVAEDEGEKLRLAASSGDLETVTQLLEAGVKVDAANEYGRTALGLAVSAGHVDVTRALLDAGANIEHRDRFYRFTPLQMAVLAKKANTVRLLIERKASGAGSAIMFIISSDQPEVLKALLADETITEKELRSALDAARSAEAKENVRLLEPLVEADQKAPADTDAATVKLSAAELKRYEGRFVGPGETELSVKVGDNELDLTIAGQDLSVTPSGEHEFRLGDAVVVTFRMKEAVADSIEWKAGGGVIEFKRAAAPAEAPDDPEETKVEPVEWSDFEFTGGNWPAFRGRLSRGIAAGQDLPRTWDAESGENVAWRAAVSGLGLSCPVVWGDNVFVSTAVPVTPADSDASPLRTGLYGDVDSVADDREYVFRLVSLSLSTGDVLWQRDCHQAKPRVRRHTKSSHANPSPATDGQHVVACFGSEGVYCFDHAGNLKWRKDLGFLDSGWFFDRSFQWGFAASPYIFDDTVYLQCDIQDQSFLVALDLETGDEKWRVDRQEIPTWSSPVVYRDPQGSVRVAVNGTREAAVYDATNGKRLWHLGGMSEIVVPTPQVSPAYVLLASGYSPIRPILAVKHSATGKLYVKPPTPAKKSEENQNAKDAEETENADADEDKSDEQQESSGNDADVAGDQSEAPEAVDQPDAFAWRLANGGSYLPTPLIYRGYVHVVSNNGVLSCFNANTGERVSRVRLRGARSCTGSPVAADGFVYITAENGKTFVVPAGPHQKPVQVNELGEAVLSTPAIAGRRLLIRGEKHLFAIGRTGQPE